MFKKTFRGIFLAVAIPLLCFSVATCIGVTTVLALQSAANFDTTVQETLSFEKDNFKSRLGFIESSGKAFFSQGYIKEYLDGNAIQGRVADGLQSFAVKNSVIMGCALYPTRDGVAPVATSNIGGLVDKNVLFSRPELAAFAASEDDSLLSIRNTAISNSYNFVYYEGSKGLMTMFLKDSPTENLGFLAIDLSTPAVYGQLISFESFAYFSGYSIVLTDEDTDLYGSRSDSLGEASLDYVLPLDFGLQAEISIPESNKNRNVWIISSSGAAIGLLLCGSSIWLSLALGRYITKPLSRLSEEMDSSMKGK